jgi:site-specific DNA-methyltransferase (adenine-specific)
MGTLCYGDNLDILRRYLKDESVDLVYLDPPFNSAQTYKAFFHEKDGTDAASQIRAFEDTLDWGLGTCPTASTSTRGREILGRICSV